MMASGNSKVQVCVQNLLKTIRGEVPYERLKGIDRTLIDQPSSKAAPELVIDVEWLIETYEPRAKLTKAELTELAAQTGNFKLSTNIETKE